MLSGTPSTNVTGPSQLFESAGELRDRHAQLLEALDRALTEASEAEATRAIEPEVVQFLERAAATGAYVETIRDRTACQALMDYWTSLLAQSGVQAPATRLMPFDGSRLPDLKDKPCPYVGLEAFRARDRAFFFGRDADVEALVAQLASTKLLVVLGASGSGKSSLVMGGVLPALASRSTPLALRIAPAFSPGTDMLQRLVKAVQEVSGFQGDAQAIAEEVRREPTALAVCVGSSPSLITIDQFEEVFTLTPAPEREAVAKALSALISSDGGHRIILTMREEFRSRIVELEPLVPYLERAWYGMRPMSYSELRLAVERPAALVNLQFQPGIVDDLVKKVLGQAAALPLLQFTLRELWNRRDRNRITRDVYRNVGDPLAALRTSADALFESLPPQTQAEVKRVLLELVRVDALLEAYRQPVPKSALLRPGKANTAEVLEQLAAQDWVRITVGDGKDEIVEVKHEALIRNWPRLVGWIDEKRVEQRQRLALMQTAERWAAAGYPEDGLLTGWQLEEAKRQEDLSEVERAFVAASAAALERVQRDRESALEREAEQARKLARRERIGRNVAIVVALVLVAAGSGLLWKYSQLQIRATQQNQNNRRLVEEREKLHVERRRQNSENARLTLENERLNTRSTSLQKVNDELTARYAVLEAKYNEANEAFTRDLKQTVAVRNQSSSTRPVRVYIHINDDSQMKRAQALRSMLDTSGIGSQSGIGRVDTSPPVTQVRYFLAEDRRGADKIADLLREHLDQRRVDVPLIKGYEHSVRKRQLYEIWFSPDAFGTADGLKAIDSWSKSGK